MDSTGSTPFVLDLGAAWVPVLLEALHSDMLGLSQFSNRRIILDPERNDGQSITSTLWHEILHHLDDLFLCNILGGDHDESKEHKQLDALANLLDMVITRNWKIWKTLYDARLQID